MELTFTNNKKLIVGIGAALIDVLIHEDDYFVKKISDIKGGMTLVNNQFIEDVLTKTNKEPEIIPGGATYNTLIGIGKLGGKAKFIGKSGKDKLGELYEKDLKKNNILPELSKSKTPTGRVLSVITPDAQRSMFTNLGASAEFIDIDIEEKYFKNAGIAIIEGYLLFNSPSPVMEAIKAAKNSGAVIAMDLSSFTVVDAFKQYLENEVLKNVDILIANEDESKAFTGYSDEQKAIKALSEYAKITVLKVGRRGSYISNHGIITRINPVGSGDAIDTTGAGDLWAAGFLYGLINNFSIKKAGELASHCGYEVCQVTGANIPDKGWQRIKKIL